MSEIHWPSLLEATLPEIHRQARDLTLPSPQLEYARVLSSYLQGDVEKLSEHCRCSSLSAETSELARLRLALRRREVASRDLHRMAGMEMSGALDGERLFCLGMAWELLQNDQMATEFFTRAAAAYRSSECPRKALRAHYNAVVAESRLTPYKNFISDYQSVIESAVEVGDRALSGLARAMLSREYQSVELLDKALAMAEQALADLESERGTIHYFHSLLQKAHVLIDLKCEGVDQLLRECELAPFAAIQAARTLLLVSRDPTLSWNRALEEDLLPTWRNRIAHLLVGRQMIEGTESSSPLEQALLRLAYNGPIEKWELIQRLYPEAGDTLALENRFKNLVARVRKKFPGQLLCHEGRYSLAKMPSGKDA